MATLVKQRVEQVSLEITFAAGASYTLRVVGDMYVPRPFSPGKSENLTSRRTLDLVGFRGTIPVVSPTVVPSVAKKRGRKAKEPAVKAGLKRKAVGEIEEDAPPVRTRAKKGTPGVRCDENSEKASVEEGPSPRDGDLPETSTTVALALPTAPSAASRRTRRPSTRRAQ